MVSAPLMYVSFPSSPLSPYHITLLLARFTLLLVRSSKAKAMLMIRKNCDCPDKLHLKATCSSMREGVPCQYGGWPDCWFGHDGPGERGREGQAGLHAGHHCGEV